VFKHRSRLRKLFPTDPGRSAIARLLAAVLASDEFVFLVGQNDGLRQEILDEVAVEFAGLRCRVVRVSSGGRDGLSLPGLLRQVLGQSNLPCGSGDDLERSHRFLTEASESCDRVVLLIYDAHALHPNALRYIQLTCRSSSSLRVVFAGEPQIVSEASEPEFRYFHGKGSTSIRLPDAACRPPCSNTEQLSAGSVGDVQLSGA